jgi:preprotein translocase subunit YajC
MLQLQRLFVEGMLALTGEAAPAGAAAPDATGAGAAAPAVPAPAGVPGAPGPVPPGGGAGGAGGQADGFALLKSFLVPMLLVFVIFWLLIFRPDSKKRKAREFAISNVKKGDAVVLQSGLLGKIWRVDGNEIVVLIDTDGNVKGRYLRSAIVEVLSGDGATRGEGSGARGDGQETKAG